MIMKTNNWVEHVEMMNTVQFRIPSSVLSGHRRVFLSYQNRYRRDSPPCEKGTSCLLWVSQRGTSQLERDQSEFSASHAPAQGGESRTTQLCARFLGFVCLLNLCSCADRD